MSLPVTILTFHLFFTLQWTKEDGHRASASAVPNLFVPLNTNPKEVQEMRNKVCTGSTSRQGERRAVGWAPAPEALCLLLGQQCGV